MPCSNTPLSLHKCCTNIRGTHAATCGLYYKCFMIIIYNCNDSMIVIYDCNDSGLYYKTMIIPRYKLKLRSKLKRNLWSYNCNHDPNLRSKLKCVIYDRKTFIVLATGNRNWKLIYPNWIGYQSIVSNAMLDMIRYLHQQTRPPF